MCVTPSKDWRPVWQKESLLAAWRRSQSFLSRIDTLVDSLSDQRRQERDDDTSCQALGQTAIACAMAAYEIYKEIFHGERFRALAAQEARPQRLLWASTSTRIRVKAT